MKFSSPEEIVAFVRTAKLKDWQARLFSQHSDELQVHSKGQLFYKIDTLFPNEHPESKSQRLLSFEPITKGSFNKGVSNIYRIFNNSSYSANVSERTAEFFSETKFDNKNLFAFFLELWVNTALKDDPNALIVVYPDKFINGKSFDQVVRVSSDDILHYDDETFVFRSELESEIEYTLNNVSLSTQVFYDHYINNLNMISSAKNTYNQKIIKTYKRTVYHVFSQNKFYRIEQQAAGIEYDVTTFDLGKNKTPPVAFAGGLQAENGVYEGFLSPFVYFGNLALLQHSQHTAVNFTFAFPRMSELQPVCDYQTCRDGYISCPISDTYPDGRMPCPSCNGSGYKSVQSPYKMYIKRYDPQGLSEDNRAMLEADDVRYYTPDTSILTYSKNEWKDYLLMAETAIFIQQKVYTGNVQSAESKNIDLDELYAYLISVAKTFYDRLRFVMQCFENYINPNPIQISVNIPYSFAILTEEQAFASLNTILTSQAPAIIKGNHIESFVSKFVSETSPVRKAYDVLKRVDLLFLKSDAEIQILKANNIVSSEAWVIHTYAYPVLMNLYETDKKLFVDDNDAIATRLQTELKKFQPVASDLRTTLQQSFLLPEPATQPNEEEE